MKIEIKKTISDFRLQLDIFMLQNNFEGKNDKMKIEVKKTINACDVCLLLDEVQEVHGYPRHIRTDYDKGEVIAEWYLSPHLCTWHEEELQNHISDGKLSWSDLMHERYDDQTVIDGDVAKLRGLEFTSVDYSGYY